MHNVSCILLLKIMNTYCLELWSPIIFKKLHSYIYIGTVTHKSDLNIREGHFTMYPCKMDQRFWPDSEWPNNNQYQLFCVYGCTIPFIKYQHAKYLAKCMLLAISVRHNIPQFFVPSKQANTGERITGTHTL